MKDILYFLRELCVNNNKEWFDKNRPRYKALRLEFEGVVNQLIADIALFDSSVATQQAKNCMFRINRDVRFSHDKSPYKTNFGAFISPGGKSLAKAGYYMHIEPDNSFISGGIYMPPSDVLLQIRTAIYEHPDEFVAILEAPEFKAMFGEIEAEYLGGFPRGFPRTFKHIQLLRFKSYTVFTPMDDDFVLTQDVAKKAMESFKVMYSFNCFLNKAIE